MMNLRRFLSPNINGRGRLLRGLGAAACLTGAAFLAPVSLIATVALAGSGLFMLFEALRGWCLLRACGIKTRL